MPITPIEFLETASLVLFDFDGKFENLQTFCSAVEIIDKIKDTHEELAVSLIKSRIKGHTRYLITNESTIAEIMDKLKKSIKGESVELLTAKIRNIQKKNKSASNYEAEIKSLSSALITAYINLGLSYDLAKEFTTGIVNEKISQENIRFQNKKNYWRNKNNHNC